MKKILYVLLILAIACTQNEKGTSANNNTPSKEKELITLVEQFPDSALLLETLVQYYRENGDYSNAIKIMNDALKKDSSNARFWDIQANLLFENADTLGSIAAFENSVDLYPKPDNIIPLGILYAQTKNPKALSFADGLILTYKAGAEKDAFFIKGLYHSYTGDKHIAIDYFDKCLNLDYTFMNAYQEKAVALYELGQYEASIKVMKRATTLQNNFEIGYYWMGKNFEKLNKKTEAIEAYQKALMYDSNYIEAKEARLKLVGKN